MPVSCLIGAEVNNTRSHAPTPPLLLKVRFLCVKEIVLPLTSWAALNCGVYSAIRPRPGSIIYLRSSNLVTCAELVMQYFNKIVR
jgi:hypothetical protein